MDFDLSFTPAAASTNGHAAGVTGAGPWTIATKTASDGLAHQVTIKNNTVNTHAGKTLTITGTDSSGRTQTESGITGPAGSATVTSTKFFAKVDSVAVSATIGADTFDIGWAATSVSHPILMPAEATLLPAFQLVVTGTINVDLASTLAHPLTYSTNVHDAPFANDANFTAKTASVAPTSLAVRAKAIRLEVNSVTAGATVRILGVASES